MTKFVTKFVAVAVILAAVAVGSSADAAFTRSLTIGSTGSDVAELQTILEAQGYLVIPAGTAKGYFGALTKNAVAKWQAAVGITPAAGYFGPISIAKLASSGSTGGSTGGNTGGSTGGSTSLSGGDGDFKSYKLLGSPNNKDVDEGDSVEVLGFEFEADDSDLLVERVDIIASSSVSGTHTNKKPWKVLEEVALVVDGDEVATVDASDEDNWDERETFNGVNDLEVYRLRFEDVNWKVDEGDKAKAYIQVTATDDIETSETGDWKIAIDDDGIRARNAEGIDVYEGSDANMKTFGLGAADAGSLNITVDSNDNDDVEVEVSEDDTTDDVLVYIAQVESEDGDNDVEQVTVSLARTSGSERLDEVIDTLYLFIDGEEVGSESVEGDDTDSVVFDDIEVTLDEDTEVDFEVRADINEQGEDGDNYANGFAFKVDGISIEIVDAQDDDITETDTTDGGIITLSLNALSVDFVSKSAKRDSEIETQGEYYIRFKVTAPKEEDIYIVNGAASSTATNTGAYFKILGTDNVRITATTSLAELSLESGGSDEGNGYYKISKGNNATFELHVVVDNNGVAARGVKVQLAGIDYNTRANTAGLVRFTSGLDDEFRTTSALLQQINVQ